MAILANQQIRLLWIASKLVKSAVMSLKTIETLRINEKMINRVRFKEKKRNQRLRGHAQ